MIILYKMIILIIMYYLFITLIHTIMSTNHMRFFAFIISLVYLYLFIDDNNLI